MRNGAHFSSGFVVVPEVEADNQDTVANSWPKVENYSPLSPYDLRTYLPTSYRMSELFRPASLLAKYDQSGLCLIFITLENLEHSSGMVNNDIQDELLIGATNRLKECINGVDILGRHGQHEFIALVFEKHGERTVLQTLQKLRNMFRKPFAIRGNLAHLSIRIGAALFPRDGRNFEDLLRKASATSCHADPTQQDSSFLQN